MSNMEANDDETEKTYIKNDLLDYAVEAKIEEAGIHDKGAGSRSSAIAHALPDEAEIAHVSTGGYQGSKAYVLLLDGYVWLDHCSYGSCTVCDAFLGSPVETTRSLLRDAYCFETAEDAEEYIKNTEDPLGWHSDQLKSEVMDLLWSAKTRDQLTADDPLAKLPDTDPETLKGMALNGIHTIGDLVAIREEWDTRKTVRGHSDVDTDEFNRLERLVEFADVDQHPVDEDLSVVKTEELNDLIGAATDAARLVDSEWPGEMTPDVRETIRNLYPEDDV